MLSLHVDVEESKSWSLACSPCSGKARLPGLWVTDIGVSHFHAIPWAKPSKDETSSFELVLPILVDLPPTLSFSISGWLLIPFLDVYLTVLGTIKNPKLCRI